MFIINGPEAALGTRESQHLLLDKTLAFLINVIYLFSSVTDEEIVLTIK